MQNYSKTLKFQSGFVGVLFTYIIKDQKPGESEKLFSFKSTILAITVLFSIPSFENKMLDGEFYNRFLWLEYFLNLCYPIN